MGGSSSRISNTIENRTVNKSDLEALNEQVNSFSSNSVTSAAAKCSASASASAAFKAGDIRVVGKGQRLQIDVDREQDVELTLDCLQQSIQEANIGNDIATSIMNNLTQTVSTDVMNKMVNEASSKLESGFLANPFAKASTKVTTNLKNIQINETNRKLSNLISNTVENNVKTEDIKKCFLETTMAINDRIGNIDLIGQDSEIILSFRSKQVSKSFASCKQLTEQTSEITNALATSLGLTIVDDTKTKTSTDVESKAKSEVKAVGLEGVIAAIFNPYIFSIVGSIILILGGIVAVYFIFIKGGGGGGDGNDDSDDSDDSDVKIPSLNTSFGGILKDMKKEAKRRS